METVVSEEEEEEGIYMYSREKVDHLVEWCLVNFLIKPIEMIQTKVSELL